MNLHFSSQTTANIMKILKVFPLFSPSMTFNRLKNILFSFLEWKFGFGIFNTAPILLTIEPVRGCNINCVMCGAGEAKKRYLSFEDFKKIIDLFDESIYIFLYLWGEPFLSKDIVKMIEYASIVKRKLVTVYSNFTILPDVESLILSEPYEITASIDTFVPEKYESIRKGASFKNVMKNLKKIVEYKRKLKKVFPIISINSVISKETIGDIEVGIKTAIEIGVDKIKLQELFPFPRKSLDIPGEEEMKELYYLIDKYRNKIKVEFMPFYGGNWRIFPRGYCFLAHFSLTMDINKDVFPCCMPFYFSEAVKILFTLCDNSDNPIFGNIANGDKKSILRTRREFLCKFRRSRPSFCRTCPLYYS